MLQCVAYLFLPGPVIPHGPLLLQKTRGNAIPLNNDRPPHFSLSHLSPISSSGAIRYPHWEARVWINVVSQRQATGSFLKDSRGATGSPWRDLEARLEAPLVPGGGRIWRPRASPLTVAGARRRPSLPVAESFIGLSAFSLGVQRVRER